MGNIQKVLDSIAPMFERLEDEIQSVIEHGIPTSAYGTIGLVILALIGVLLAFFGLAMIRFWGAFFGFVFGVIAGYAAGSALIGLEIGTAIIAGLVAGLLFAVLGAVFKVIGGIIISLILITYTFALILSPQSMLMLGICSAVGLIVALLGIKFRKTVAVIATAAGGGMLAGVVIIELLGIDLWFAAYIAAAVLMIIGIMIQFVHISRSLEKQSIRKAEEIKKEVSVENEIEAARGILDRDDVQDDDIQIVNDFAEEEK